MKILLGYILFALVVLWFARKLKDEYRELDRREDLKFRLQSQSHDGQEGEPVVSSRQEGGAKERPLPR
ncbi:MAG: hypothetical protein WCV68_03010 [Candidatus Paceibacterota bacterium]|jgi:hypothetical protein